MTQQDQQDKIRADRLRRAAQRQGLTLEKSRARDPRALRYGKYRLLDRHGKVAHGDPSIEGFSLTLDDAERILTG